MEKLSFNETSESYLVDKINSDEKFININLIKSNEDGTKDSVRSLYLILKSIPEKENISFTNEIIKETDIIERHQKTFNIINIVSGFDISITSPNIINSILPFKENNFQFIFNGEDKLTKIEVWRLDETEYNDDLKELNQEYSKSLANNNQ